MSNSMHPHQTHTSVHYRSLQNSFSQGLHVPPPVYYWGGGVCVCVCLHWLVSPSEHNTLSHYKYMPAVLHNWIKREATVPQNKKAVRLMRTRSGSERYRIVPVSISCLVFLWVTPKNIGQLLCIKCVRGQSFNVNNCGLPFPSISKVRVSASEQ